MPKAVIVTLAILSSLSKVDIAENKGIKDVISLISSWKIRTFNCEYNVEKMIPYSVYIQSILAKR